MLPKGVRDSGDITARDAYLLVTIVVGLHQPGRMPMSPERLTKSVRQAPAYQILSNLTIINGVIYKHMYWEISSGRETPVEVELVSRGW
ncbi:hypothetical protein RSOLAG1IB_04095 [Rhizoctonia solani AG-1 IB]|uniref:Uncharacterized protein n=1 Tax=Thanatephorus cucumeris (strain AG1-IB / isolate 7/3/14) TaxID=1108050 RepID=A0A0B7FS99_THACB|nr:hypothetical protein RSOLAG1IB_04095 [Rhizoctonia solani AG-1 IB]